jgi:hypothetical protein
MSDLVVQFLPRLDNYGVASHASALAQALEANAGLRSQFVVARSGESLNGGHRDSVTLSNLEDREVADVLSRFDGAPVLMHYSSYGYAKRGNPGWLIRGIERWQRQSGAGRLVTVFHELYATGMPWQSSFWLSPVQRHLAARLHRVSSGAVTSLERYAQALRGWKEVDTLAILPVFSTIGEPIAPRALASRRRRLVVFGSPGLRARGYSAGGPALTRACRAFGIEEIVDVGPSQVAPPTVNKVPVLALGRQPSSAVSELLADSVAGYLHYPHDYLPKSTVFAAYSAHRLVPVCTWSTPRSRSAERFPCWDTVGSEASDWQQIADSAYAWYQGHSLERHAALYQGLLQ